MSNTRKIRSDLLQSKAWVAWECLCKLDVRYIAGATPLSPYNTFGRAAVLDALLLDIIDTRASGDEDTIFVLNTDWKTTEVIEEKTPYQKLTSADYELIAIRCKTLTEWRTMSEARVANIGDISWKEIHAWGDATELLLTKDQRWDGERKMTELAPLRAEARASQRRRVLSDGGVMTGDGDPSVDDRPFGA